MSTSSSSKRCCQFSLEEINAVTNQFGNKLLGKGGEAMVYFAEIYIGSKKTPVAVKYLKDTTKEFESEIQTLPKIQHPNIVSLIGYCNESGQKILVYEYMEKGCLSDYLNKKKDKPLSWLQRLNICLDVARGLQHLHSETNEFPKGLIHRDVKPGNILVGENWVGKLSDFGMLKLSNAGQVKSSMVTDRKGTSGYFAPEYHKFSRVTRKIDVYAFGVVLFQVLCEKMPWDREDESYYFDENEDLGIWAQENVDAQIRREMSGDSFTLFTDIIGRSLQGNPGKRPTMEKVVLDLEKVLLECQESENQPKQLDDTEEIYLQPSPSKRPTIDDVVLNLQKVLGYKSIKVDKLTEESKVEEKKPETDSSGNQKSPPVVEAKDGQTEKSGGGGGGSGTVGKKKKKKGPNGNSAVAEPLSAESPNRSGGPPPQAVSPPHHYYPPPSQYHAQWNSYKMSYPPPQMFIDENTNGNSAVAEPPPQAVSPPHHYVYGGGGSGTVGKKKKKKGPLDSYPPPQMSIDKIPNACSVM